MNYLDILPFKIEIDRVLIASSCLWSLALYLALSKTKNWLTDQLERWFNFAERSLYLSQEEFDKTRLAREAQNSFYASIFSIIPFLMIGFICNWLIAISLGDSWSLSLGILASMGSGIFELGRRNSE
jgi:hypothetical protein